MRRDSAALGAAHHGHSNTAHAAPADGADSEGTFAYSPETGTDDPDKFTVDSEAVFNSQGNVTVLVSRDGTRYTVVGDGFVKTFSAVDSDNQR